MEANRRTNRTKINDCRLHTEQSLPVNYNFNTKPVNENLIDDVFNQFGKIHNTKSQKHLKFQSIIRFEQDQFESVY